MRRYLLLLIIAFFIGSGAEAKKVTAPRSINVACVGNSITYGYLLQNREQDSYPSQLQSMLGNRYRVGNFGRNSATLLEKGSLPYISTEQYAAALAMKPDVVIIHLGINDTDPNNYAQLRDDFVGDYLRLIDNFRQVNPQAVIYVARLTPITYRHPRFAAGLLDWYNKIQADIERVADSAKVFLVDFNEPLYRRPDLLPDSFHPNEQGAKLLAKAAFEAVTGNYSLTMPLLFGDNMVLQRGQATKIEAKANRNAKVTVSLSNGLTAQTQADHYGRWSVELPLNRAEKSLTLVIESEGKRVEYQNVAIGQVWILSGQSNMSWSVERSTSPSDARANDSIRLFRMTPTMESDRLMTDEELDALNELDFIGCDGWKVANSEQIAPFSAIGYYFAQMLCDSIREPIGLVQTSLGGAPAELFISRKRIENDPSIRGVLGDPTTNPMLNWWCRSVMANGIGERVGTLQRHYYEPTYIYESRLYPLSNYPIAGVLWHQGESNAWNVELYERLFPQVVATFCDLFSRKDLPFYFVQLAEMTSQPSWRYFRDSQAKMAAEIPNCQMVISRDYTDLNNIHPPVKRPIGERLAKIALDKIYN